MLILGISCFYHDAAATLIEDGHILCAAQEERFSRIKQDEQFPAKSIQFCLNEAGITFEQIDFIVFYEKPLLKFERILEIFTEVAPKGLSSFLFALPKWINEKIFFKSLLIKNLKQLGDFQSKKNQILFTEHHISHAASAYYPSTFSESAILVVDGVGEWATVTISKGNQFQIDILQEIHFPHSFGMLYSAFTYFLGFKVNSGEYKLMGLSPYGNKHSETVENYKNLIYKHLIKSRAKEGFQLNLHYFTFTYRLQMIDDTLWEKLFGIKKRKEEEPITQQHADLALAIQEVTDELMLELVTLAKALTQSENLCLSGGVALNCVSNGKIIHSGHFKNYFIPSSPGDSGGAIGAALYAFHQYQSNPISVDIAISNQNAFLGPAIVDSELNILHRQYQAVSSYWDEEQLYTATAEFLTAGKIVGWVQGKMEFGPRALGNRSILALPTIPGMQSKLNIKIKFREDFRPFAPVLKKEAVSKYFNLPQNAHYMEYIVELRDEFKIPLPSTFENLSLTEKLTTPRSLFQAVTHIDYTARPQTVSQKSNPPLYLLLTEIEKKTGHPILVNTSFNVRGEPIVCNALDAYACFMQTDMDILVIGNHVFEKEKQPKTYAELFKNRTFSKD